MSSDPLLILILAKYSLEYINISFSLFLAVKKSIIITMWSMDTLKAKRSKSTLKVKKNTGTTTKFRVRKMTKVKNHLVTALKPTLH